MGALAMLLIVLAAPSIADERARLRHAWSSAESDGRRIARDLMRGKCLLGIALAGNVSPSWPWLRTLCVLDPASRSERSAIAKDHQCDE